MKISFYCERSFIEEKFLLLYKWVEKFSQSCCKIRDERQSGSLSSIKYYCGRDSNTKNCMQLEFRLW